MLVHSGHDDKFVVFSQVIGQYILEADRVSCQEKYGFIGSSLAPVGGYIEADELPLVAAKREVLEELGLASTDWVPLRSPCSMG